MTVDDRINLIEQALLAAQQSILVAQQQLLELRKELDTKPFPAPTAVHFKLVE
jgi:hypothetical protein